MLTYATYNDLTSIEELAVLVVKDMEKSNIPQWTAGYPAYKDFVGDIDNNALIIYKEDDKVLGSITILPENDPPYKTINSWIKEKSIVIHRMLVHPESRNKGIARKLLNEAIKIGKKGNYESIKIDTHLKNFKMRNFLKKNGFVELEYLETIDRLAYELVLEEKNMKKLLVVWKSDNEIDINNFVIPYVYNSKKHEWFSEVELLIWGASQEKIMEDTVIQQRVKNLVKNEVTVYACKMCADNIGATDLLESLGAIVMYTGVFLSDKMKDPDTEVLTI